MFSPAYGCMPETQLIGFHEDTIFGIAATMGTTAWLSYDSQLSSARIHFLL